MVKLYGIDNYIYGLVQIDIKSGRGDVMLQFMDSVETYCKSMTKTHNGLQANEKIHMDDLYKKTITKPSNSIETVIRVKIYVIFMELLCFFGVKIVNIVKRVGNTIDYPDKYPVSSFLDIRKNSDICMNGIARG